MVFQLFFSMSCKIEVLYLYFQPETELLPGSLPAGHPELLLFFKDAAQNFGTVIHNDNLFEFITIRVKLHKIRGCFKKYLNAEISASGLSEL